MVFKRFVTAKVGLGLLSVAVVGSVVCGCTAISISPQCPAELRVGETGTVLANERNSGSVARYLWEAFPASAGTFANPQAAVTTFQALEEGVVTLRLTASDGLYQMIDECTVVISGSLDLAVSLGADPATAAVDEVVTLTCDSIGSDLVDSFVITQTAGHEVDLSEIDPGVVRFTAAQEDDLTFRCIGSDENEEESTPSTITVAITATVDDGGENESDDDEE